MGAHGVSQMCLPLWLQPHMPVQCLGTPSGLSWPRWSCHNSSCKGVFVLGTRCSTLTAESPQRRAGTRCEASWAGLAALQPQTRAALPAFWQCHSSFCKQRAPPHHEYPWNSWGVLPRQTHLQRSGYLSMARQGSATKDAFAVASAQHSSMT